MKSYLCFIQVRPDSVPELRALACDDDAQLREPLADTLREWAALHLVEVMDGERMVFRATAPDLDQLRIA